LAVIQSVLINMSSGVLRCPAVFSHTRPKCIGTKCAFSASTCDYCAFSNCVIELHAFCRQLAFFLLFSGCICSFINYGGV